MRSRGHYRWSVRLPALAMLLACGCVSQLFGPKGGGPPADPGAGLAAQWQGGARPGLKPQGANVPAGYQPPPSQPFVANEQMATMSSKLHDSDDDRKALGWRLQQVEKQLQEKDKIIVLTKYEIQEAAKEVSQTREELKRWKQEMETLRGQLHSAEKENKGTLEAIIRTLEQFMDREKETVKVSGLNGPALR
jgi:hypothetical protein